MQFVHIQIVVLVSKMEKNIELERAIECIHRHVQPIQRRVVLPLAKALNHRLAEPFFAPMDNPPFDRSPLDGFTFDSKDSGIGKRLKIVGCVYAGEAFMEGVQPGEAVRIMTGAPIPRG